RILRAGGKVSLAANGSFIASGIDPERMKAFASELALKVRATGSTSEPARALAAPRVAIYSSWVANMDEGWTRWLLEQFEFPFRELHNADVQSGDLQSRFDAIIIPEMSARTILDGHQAGTIPGEYAGGMGATGLDQLKQFVRAGGTLITLGNA